MDPTPRSVELNCFNHDEANDTGRIVFLPIIRGYMRSLPCTELTIRKELDDPLIYEITIRGTANDHGNGYGEDATLIELGVPVHGVISHPFNRDWFKFKIPFRQQYLATLESETLGDASLWVALASGESLFIQKLGLGEMSFVADVPPENADFYYVSVGGLDDGGTGAYQLTVTGLPDDHGNERLTATDLIDGLPVPGRFDYEGDIDMFAFEAEQGRTYEIRTTRESELVTARLCGQKPSLFCSETRRGNVRKTDAKSITDRLEAPSTGKYSYQVNTSFSSDLQVGQTYTVTVTAVDDSNAIEDPPPKLTNPEITLTPPIISRAGPTSTPVPTAAPPPNQCPVEDVSGWFEPVQGVWQDDYTFDDKTGKQLSPRPGPGINRFKAELPMVAGRETLLFGVRGSKDPNNDPRRVNITVQGEASGTKEVPVHVEIRLKGREKPLYVGEEKSVPLAVLAIRELLSTFSST